MNVLHHVIKDEEIIGIGPLIMETAANDPAMAGFVNYKQLYFMVYLTRQSLKVESLHHHFGQNVSPEEIQQSQAAFEQFKAEYEKTKKAIADLINKKKRP